jgi:hypothetical protein
MQGGKITQASKALQVLLRSLPANSYFNIVGFGSSYTCLFSKSVEYNASTLEKAEKAMSNLQADLGGTEIQQALEKVFEMRRKDMPTQVFVLTDGEVWNSEALFASISENVAKSLKDHKGENFLRVFSLGIGDDVSHDLVEGMARHGQGFAQFVGENEKLNAKMVKMVKAAVLPPVRDWKIDWTNGAVRGENDNGFEMVADSASTSSSSSSLSGTKPKKVKKEGVIKKVISLFDMSGEKKKDGADKSAAQGLTQETVEYEVNRDVQQAPHRLPNFFPGNRFTVSTSALFRVFFFFQTNRIMKQQSNKRLSVLPISFLIYTF